MTSRLKTFIALMLIGGVCFVILRLSLTPPQTSPTPSPSSNQRSRVQNAPTPLPEELEKKMLAVIEPPKFKKDILGKIQKIQAIDIFWKQRTGAMFYYQFAVDQNFASIRPLDPNQQKSENCSFDSTLRTQLFEKLNSAELCKYDYYPDEGETCAPTKIPAEMILNPGANEILIGERSDLCALDQQVCGLKLRNEIQIIARKLISSVQCD